MCCFMKRTANHWLFVLIFSLLLLSCTERRILIGVSQCSNDIWRQKVNQEIHIGEHQYNNVDVVITSADNDAKKQVRQIDSLMSEGIDLLVVAPSDEATLEPAIKRVFDKGIPVVLYDRKINFPCYTAYIGGDNEGIGKVVAHFLAEKLNGKGTVVEITGEKGSSPVMERHRGFAEGLKAYPQIKVVTLNGDWEVAGAKALMKKYLAEGGHADVVFGHNDAEAEGAWRAAQEMGVDKQMMFVGVDGLPGVNQGIDHVRKEHFVASYVYPTQGERVIALAMNILLGKPYQKENKMQSYLAIKENADVIEMQYKDIAEKVKGLDDIYDSIDDYLSMYHRQRWVIGIAIVFILLLVFMLFRLYRLYKTKAAKQKVVAQSFVNEKENPAVEELQLDESERYFIDRFKKKVVEKMGDENLNMDALGAELHLSKVQMYRKVKALTGKTPAELLKEMRLHKAHQLLTQTDKTISEIASEVGFAIPGYFSACFKKQFGINPTELRK